MTIPNPNPSVNPNPNPPPVPLAPGFRFHPTDEELVIYYLKRKILNRPLKLDAIAEIDLYKLEPWELPPKSRIRSRDLEWYFFSPLDRKYSNKSRTNRATKEGYWKTTGKDREVKRGEKIVGMKKTLVFHVGRAPSGKRTNWVMHEYRIEGDGVLEEISTVETEKAQDLYVVCRIFQKTGSGPQNGAQYGAPFMEEEWEQETAGDDVMAGVMRAEKDEEDFNNSDEHEFVQMNDLLPPQNHDPSLISTDLNANSKPTNQLIKQEIEESNHTDQQIENTAANHDNTAANHENTTDNHENTTDNYIMTDWQPEASWPLRTRGDQSLPNSSEYDDTTLSEILNVEEFFDNSIVDDNNDENNNDNNDGSVLETGQTGQEDPIRSAVMCDYDYLEDEGKTVFFDADDGEVADGRCFDDLMAYFDETDVGIKYDIMGSEKAELVEPLQNVEQENVTAFNASVKTEQKEIYKGESSSSCSSSSDVKPSIEDSNHLKRKTFDMPSDFSDIHGDEYSDKSSIRKRLVSMLGSMSAPKAIASEFPSSSSKSLAAANSAGPIRVTAGIIQIVNLHNSNKSWSVHKNGTDCENLVLKLVPVEPIEDRDDEVAVFTVFRGGFYLFFMSMAILTISYKLSMCVYGR